MQMHDIAHQRLGNLQIAQTVFTKPSEVVAWLGAIQGQDYAGAKWSLGLRLHGSTDADIEQAIADQTIVRTWAMRGTLHIVAAADVRWLVALLGPRIIANSARRYRELELDEPTLTRSNKLLTQALADGKRHTRTALFAILEENGISTKGQRGVHMLQRASLDGLICQGATQRNNPTFVLIDESLPQGTKLARDEALVALAQRYFLSRGPATFNDYVAWSGLTTTDARAGLEALKDQLIEEKVDGKIYWMPQKQSKQRKSAQNVYLLPGFDEYMLGYRDRSAILDPQHAQLIVPGGNGIFYSTIVSDGRVVGIWKRAMKKNTVVITPQPFQQLSEAEQQGVHAAAEEYGTFLQMSVSLDDSAT
jgi:hypothetical protein